MDLKQRVDGSTDHRSGANPQRHYMGDAAAHHGKTAYMNASATATFTVATSVAPCCRLLHSVARLNAEHCTTKLWAGKNSDPSTCKDMTTTKDG